MKTRSHAWRDVVARYGEEKGLGYRLALDTQNEMLVEIIVKQIRKLPEQYDAPPIKRGIAQTDEAREVANKIAQDISSLLVKHSQLFDR